MNFNRLRPIACVFTLLWLVSCRAGRPSAATPTLGATLSTATQVTGTLPAQTESTPLAPSSTRAASPSERLLHLSGEAWASSEIIRLASQSAIEASWEYTGTGLFALWLVNTDEEVLDPAYDRILLVAESGPTSGVAQSELIAGDYRLEVEQATGPWMVELRRLP